jgi:hypothetical protein
MKPLRPICLRSFRSRLFAAYLLWEGLPQRTRRLQSLRLNRADIRRTEMKARGLTQGGGLVGYRTIRRCLSRAWA